jgi:hypothetical protein
LVNLKKYRLLLIRINPLLESKTFRELLRKTLQRYFSTLSTLMSEKARDGTKSLRKGLNADSGHSKDTVKPNCK